MHKQVLIKLRQSWLIVMNSVKIGGLQMAIIPQKMYKKCKLCLLFVWACCCGCQNSEEKIDQAVKNICSDVEIEIRTFSRTDSAHVLSLCRKLERNYPNSAYAKVIAHIGYAEVYERWREKKKAKECTDIALSLAKKWGYYREEGYIYLQKLDLSENLEEALGYLQQFEALEEIKDPFLLHRFYFEFGYYNYEIKDLFFAKKYFIKSLEISRKNKLSFEENNSLNALSVIFNEEHKYLVALKLIDEAIRVCQLYCPIECGDNFYEKAVILYEIGEYNKAKKEILRAKNAYNSHPNPYNPGVIEGILGDIYFHQKKYKEAEQNYLAFLKKATFSSTRIWAYNKLTHFYAQTGNYKNAWIYSHKFSFTRDSIYSSDRTSLLINKREEFDRFQKEQELDKTKTKYKYALIIALFAVLSVVILIVFSYYNNLLKNRLAKLEQDKLQQEIEFEQRRLALSTLQLSQHNDVLKNLKKDIEKIGNIDPELIKNQTRSIIKTLENDLNIDNEWDKFKWHFEAVSPHFFEMLKERSTQLTDLDLKHCAYLKMKLTPKQVAQILGVAPKSVTLSRVRIKKKLQLPEEESLADFLQKI